jgi:4-hydroxy-tetrahydrodipicolinate reductase
VPDYAAAAADAGVAFVTGTTGLDDAARAALDGASESVPVMHAPNFARGVAALRRAVREAVATLEGYDVELTDTHHRGKVDAPSGTAAALLEDVASVRGDARSVHGREGHRPREVGEVGVHSRRAGDVAGEHEVLIAGSDEALTLTHRTDGREVYAAGALDAAAWLAGRDAGRHEFAEVLDG